MGDLPNSWDIWVHVHRGAVAGQGLETGFRKDCAMVKFRTFCHLRYLVVLRYQWGFGT